MDGRPRGYEARVRISKMITSDEGWLTDVMGASIDCVFGMLDCYNAHRVYLPLGFICRG